MIRPTATGMMMVRSINGPEAADSYTWNVTVHKGEEVVELPSGAIAIVEPTEEGETETAPVPPKPESIEDPTALADAKAQRFNSEYEIAKASTETSANVIAVIAQPWILLADETIIPASIAVAPVIYEPNEYILTVRMPAEAFAASIYPVQVVETASVSTATGNCLPGSSPCGTPNLDHAAQYAVFWGNENHIYAGRRARNPYYQDFGADNCTNFISQIIRAGGQKFMLYPHHGDGSWWYKRILPWEEGRGAEFFPGEFTQSWTLADVLPRHLWQYALVRIDPVQEPYGWTKGDIVAED